MSGGDMLFGFCLAVFLAGSALAGYGIHRFCAEVGPARTEKDPQACGDGGVEDANCGRNHGRVRPSCRGVDSSDGHDW